MANMSLKRTKQIISWSIFLSITLMAFLCLAQFPQEECSVECVPEPEPNPTPIDYGCYTTGCGIAPQTDIDTYSFVGSAGDNVRLIVRSNSNCFDPTMDVRDPQGTVITTLSCDGSSGYYCNQCSNSQTIFLAVSGTYLLIIHDTNSDENGNYEITLGCLLGSCPLCIDGDTDGYGDPASPHCTYPEWDCDDTDPDANPGEEESESMGNCSDGKDNDCDGLPDEDDPDCPLECIDNDADGYGDPGSAACVNPEQDCNDSNEWIYPTNTNSYCNCEDPDPQGTGIELICDDGIDNDCDRLTDTDEDPDCAPCNWPGTCPTDAEASVYSSANGKRSMVVNNLAFLIIPVGAVIFLRILRRKK